MRRQIVLLTTAATATIALAFVVPLAIVVRTLIETHAVDDADRLGQTVASEVAVADPSRVGAVLDRLSLQTANLLTVYMPDGTVIGATEPPAGADSLRLAQSGRAFNQHSDGGVAVFVPVTLEPDHTTVLRVFVPGHVLRDDLVTIWAILAALGLGLVGVSALAAARTARSITTPLLETSEAARALAGGDMDARAPEAGSDEVRAVGAALNELASRIRALLQEERESLADLSHGLRTPLTALRLEAESLDDPSAAPRLHAAVDRMEHAVSELIDQVRRPRETSGRGDHRQAVRERVAFWAVLAHSQQRELVLDIGEATLLVRAERADLDATIDALIGNVFGHTSAGTAFAVRVARRGAFVQLVVEDHGPGITSARERGSRDPRSRGTGLGLDIARRAAARSGGDLRIERSDAGGARVVVRFAAAVGPKVPGHPADRGDHSSLP